MRSQRSIVRKAAKARARRKAFTKTKNMNANVPVKIYTTREPVYSQVHVRDGGPVIMQGGRPKLEVAGYREKIRKDPIYSNPDPSNKAYPGQDIHGRNIGMAAYTLRKKVIARKELLTNNK